MNELFPANEVASESPSPRRRFVTVVYEIVDDFQWGAAGNPLHFTHHGLRAVGVSVGDLMGLVDEIEGDVDESVFSRAHQKHVVSSLPL